MTQSLMISNDPEINQLIDETLEGLQSMDKNGLKGMMRYGAILFKTAKEQLTKLEGSTDDDQ